MHTSFTEPTATYGQQHVFGAPNYTSIYTVGGRNNIVIIGEPPHRTRQRMENSFDRINNFRRVTTGCDKSDASFAATLDPAVVVVAISYVPTGASAATCNDRTLSAGRPQSFGGLPRNATGHAAVPTATAPSWSRRQSIWPCLSPRPLQLSSIMVRCKYGQYHGLAHIPTSARCERGPRYARSRDWREVPSALTDRIGSSPSTRSGTPLLSRTRGDSRCPPI